MSDLLIYDISKNQPSSHQTLNNNWFCRCHCSIHMTMLRMIIFVMVPLFYCLTNEYSCQVSEDKGLNKRYQHFNYIYKSSKSNRDR